jgi:hypothetical protein
VFDDASRLWDSILPSAAARRPAHKVRMADVPERLLILADRNSVQDVSADFANPLSLAKTPSAPLNLPPFPVVTKNVTSRIWDPGEAHASFREGQPDARGGVPGGGLRAVASKGTHQEAPGTTIPEQDKAAYARQDAAFFHIDSAAGIPATHVGAAAHTVDGAIVKRNSLPLTFLGATSPSTVWTAASAIIDHPRYAQTKRKTLNQNPETSLGARTRIGYKHTHSEPQGINLSEPETCRRMGSTPHSKYRLPDAPAFGRFWAVDVWPLFRCPPRLRFSGDAQRSPLQPVVRHLYRLASVRYEHGRFLLRKLYEARPDRTSSRQCRPLIHVEPLALEDDLRKPPPRDTFHLRVIHSKVFKPFCRNALRTSLLELFG